ncbi:MAG: hypothetical protein Q8N13_10525 [Acidovorax sp.]|nr:hypothetical protein [Acidovorax sp.]
MKQDTLKVRINVKVSWWVAPLIQLCALCAKLSRCHVDVDAVGRFIGRHGVKVEVRP